MTSDRRQHERLVKPFDGRWSGASGATECRISDISLGGCFVQGMAAPAIGERATVTISFGQNFAMSITGTVVYVEKGMGFAVKFADLPDDELGIFTQFLQQIGTKDARGT